MLDLSQASAAASNSGAKSILHNASSYQRARRR